MLPSRPTSCGATAGSKHIYTFKFKKTTYIGFRQEHKATASIPEAVDRLPIFEMLRCCPSPPQQVAHVAQQTNTHKQTVKQKQ
jgi:hypothetical protein